MVVLMQSSAAESAVAAAVIPNRITANKIAQGDAYVTVRIPLLKSGTIYFGRSIMVNYMIIGILAVAVIIGIRSTIKHFKGEGGCCGSGSYKPKKKKLSNIIYRKTFKVEGMHCAQCKARVEEVVNDMKGVAGKVNLKRGELTISYAENVDDELIRKRIEKAGYTVTEII